MSTNPVIKWRNEFSVGIKEIDDQHRSLIDLLNEMHDAIIGNKHPEVLLSIFERQLNHTRIHFAVEESLMRMYDYPGYVAHKREHELLLSEAMEIYEKAASGESRASTKLLNFLSLWLTDHIQDSDKDYIPYIQQHNSDKVFSANDSWIKRLFR